MLPVVILVGCQMELETADPRTTLAATYVRLTAI